MIEPFLSAVPVLEKLEDAGFEAYFVGGSVRDYLLKKTISDVDIATSATPEEVKRIFSKTVDIGIEHGTVLVLFNGGSYEITTFRTEAEYQDFRRPKEVSFIRNLQDDLQRRDFTMNAIAMDRMGKLIDPFNGQAAIREKMIQTVGLAEERFGEDALRMMRAVRFVSQLSFTIESETIKALTEQVHLLEHIAVERKRVEFEKTLAGRNKVCALRILLDTKMFKFLPGLKKSKREIEYFLTFPSDGLQKNEMWSLLIFCLDMEDTFIETFLRDWRLPMKEIRDIQQIVLFLKRRLKQEWSLVDLYAAGLTTVLSAERLNLVINCIKKTESIDYWRSQYEALPIKSRSEINVSGGELMDWFDKSGGPWVRDILSKIENQILEGNIRNEKEEIKEWLMQCSQK